MNDRQNSTSRANGHACGIFMKSHIPPIMQSGFNLPVCAAYFQHFYRSSLFSCQAGQAQLDFTTGFVGLALPKPEEFAFQVIDLAEAGPIEIVIEHLTGLYGADFDPTVSITHLFGGLKVSRNLAKPRFGLIGSK